MPDYVLDSVRSMRGVKYAVPLYSGGALVKLADGTFQPVTVIGLDDTSLFGRPSLIAGRIQDLYADDAFVVVHDSEFPKLNNPAVGTTFEINDHRGVVVGIAKVPLSGLFGIPTLYTTYRRAIEVRPDCPLHALLRARAAGEPRCHPRHPRGGAAPRLPRAHRRRLRATRSNSFYMYQTGLGTNLLIMTVISFVVGLSISGQTFYTFVLENLERFGALKAIGAKSRELVYVILFQASSRA